LLDLRKQQAQAININVTLSEYAKDLKAALTKPLTTTDKRQFLEASGVRVTATPGKYTFTTEMNFASEDWNEEQDTYMLDVVNQIEAEHPDITLLDWADHKKMLPNDHPLTKASNELKQRRIETAKQKPRQPRTKRSYITIEQTSA
jgi:hypothetical protein